MGEAGQYRTEETSASVGADGTQRYLTVIRNDQPTVLGTERAPPPAPLGATTAAHQLIERLCRRKVAQWMFGYFALSWVVLQLGDILSETWGWPRMFQKAVSLTLGLGAFPALVVAWFHGERGRQDICLAELTILIALVAMSASVLWRFFWGAS